MKTTTRATTYRRDQRSVVAGGPIGSDAVRGPVPFGGPVDAAGSRDLHAVLAHGVGHREGAVEQPLDLALVEVDAHDLALDLVGDVGELGGDAHVGREAGQRIEAQVGEALEVV